LRRWMRPHAFPDDEILQAIAIEIGHRERVRLREADAELCLRAAVAHEFVFFERDLATRFHLLEPRESPAVRVERGDDVRESVTVYVIRKHLRAAFVLEKHERMRKPRRTAFGGLLPPAVFEQQVEPALP